MQARAAFLTEPYHVQIGEQEVSRPGPGQMMVEMRACAICTLEKRLYNGSLRIHYPLVPGHEAVGVVREVGPDDNSGLNPDDVVALDLRYRCGECFFCRKGASHLCLNRFKDRNRMLGGMAEFKVIPSRQAFRIGTAAPFEELALTEPIAACLHSIKKVSLSHGDRILVVGAGVMGLLHLLLLKRAGHFVAVSDLKDDRLALAKRLGADLVINAREGKTGQAMQEITDGRGCEVAFIVSPGEDACRQALESVRALGTVVFYAATYPAITLSIDTNLIHYKEITIIGSESRTELDFLEATGLQSERAFDLGSLISSTFVLSDVSEAFQRAMDGDQLRVVVTMGGSSR